MPEFCSAGVKNRYSLKQHFIINFGFTLKKSREACDTLLSPPLPSPPDTRWVRFTTFSLWLDQ